MQNQKLVKTNSNLFVLFLKWKSKLYEQAILKFDPRDNLNGKFLTQGDFTIGPTFKKDDKTREIYGLTNFTVKVATGPIEKSKP